LLEAVAAAFCKAVAAVQAAIEIVSAAKHQAAEHQQKHR
jgi:hypothetical protein